MNIENYNKLSCHCNGYFFLIYYDEDRNVTKNKELAETLEIDEKELRMFLKVSGCEMLLGDYIVKDSQNIDKIFNDLKEIFNKDVV